MSETPINQAEATVTETRVRIPDDVVGMLDKLGHEDHGRSRPSMVEKLIVEEHKRKFPDDLIA